MRLFIAIGGLVLILLLTALIAPLFVDWTGWRASFEAEASRLLGQPVQVHGEASARLLPFPSVTFTDVQVGDEAPGHASMRLDSFRMDAELAPYLSGEIRIFRMELGAPHLTIPFGAGAQPPKLATGLTESGAHVILEDVVVTDGALTLFNGSTGQRRELRNIDARLSAGTLQGPFRGSGSLASGTEKLDFSLSSGTIEPDGHWPFRLALTSPRLATSFTFDGSTELGDGLADFEGLFELQSPAKGLQLAQNMPPVRATTTLDFDGTDASFTELRVEVGQAEAPYVLTGEGASTSGPIPHFRLKLEGEQINVDTLAEQTLEKTGAITLADRVEALRRALNAIPPLPVAGEVQLDLPVFTIGDTTIRALTLTAAPNADGWAVRNLSAELPGRTLVEASGLAFVRQELAFRGDLLLAARQPSGLVNWLGGASDTRLSALSRAGFSAKVDLSLQRQNLESLEVDVGGQSLTGRIERSGNDGAMSVSADLSGEAVDVENFLAFARLFMGDSAFVDADGALDVRFSAAPVRYAGMQAEAGEIDLTYADGLLDLHNLSLSGFEGANLEARGMLEAQKPDFAFEMTVDDPARLAVMADRIGQTGLIAMPEIARRIAGHLAPGAYTGSITRAAEGGEIALQLNGGSDVTTIESRVAAAPEWLAGAGGNAGFNADLVVQTQDPVAWLGQFGLAGLDLGVGAPLRISAQLSGPAQDMKTAFAAAAPGFQIRADGTTGWTLAGLSAADLTTHLQSDNLSPWLSAVGIAAGQGIDTLPAELQARLEWSTESWSVSDLAGAFAETRFENSHLSRSADAPMQGQVTLSDLSLPWLATMVFGVDPEAAGAEWPDAPFTTAFTGQVPPFAIDVTAATIALGGETLLSDAALQLRGDPEGISVEGLTAKLAGGDLSASGRMQNAAGFGSLALNARLTNAAMPGNASPVTGQLSLEFAGQATGQSFREMATTGNGNGSASLSNAVFNGFAPPDLATILPISDAEGFQADSLSVTTLVAENAAQQAPVMLENLPLSMTLGVLNAGPARFSLAAGEASGEGSFRLADLTGHAQIVVDYQPHELDRIDNTAPAISYTVDWPADTAFSIASAEPLTSFLALRAYQMEQRRLQATRDDLQETLRLRREVRYFNDLTRQRQQRAEEAERQRAEAEARAAAEAEARAAEAAAAQARSQQNQSDAGASAPEPPTPALELPDLLLPRPDAGRVPPFEYDLTPAPQAPREEIPDLPGVNPSMR